MEKMTKKQQIEDRLREQAGIEFLPHLFCREFDTPQNYIVYIVGNLKLRGWKVQRRRQNRHTLYTVWPPQEKQDEPAIHSVRRT